MEEKKQERSKCPTAFCFCEVCETGFRRPFLARIFCIIGALAILLAIGLTASVIFVCDKMLTFTFALTFFGSGLFYCAVGALIRNTAESAWNTRQVLLCHCHKEEK